MTGQDWDRTIVAISEEFGRARSGEGAALLRALHQALLKAPRPVSDALGDPCRSTDIDRMLSNACLHDVAFALAGRAGVLVSRSPEGAVHATMIARGLFDETDSYASSIPLAIGGALSAGLAEWVSERDAPTVSRATH